VWRMPSGDRVLTETEWALYSDGVQRLQYLIREEIDGEDNAARVGIPVFDSLTPEQKLVLLAETTLALRDPTIPTPKHTAANEGTIDAVIATIESDLEVEIDLTETSTEGESFTETRRLLLAVCRESEDGDEPLPDESYEFFDDWRELLEGFANRIFWDHDFAMDDEFLDLPPQESRRRMKAMNIAPDYYLSVPDDPDEAGLIAARQTLARLLGLPVPDDDGNYPAIYDLFYGLFSGPCPDDEIDEWLDHPWVQVVAMSKAEWDCDYVTWLREFRPGLPAAPFQFDPEASVVGGPLESEYRFERRGECWVVLDDKGWYWCGLVDGVYSDDPDDDFEPALTFATEADARAARAQANQMYSAREERNKEAMARIEELRRCLQSDTRSAG
jgi:hypothetical protein